MLRAFMDSPSLLLTRPQASAEAFVARLDPALVRGVEVCISPLMEIRPCRSGANLADYRGVIFTSANGVAFAGLGQGRRAYCVGAGTARAATDQGWHVMQVAQDADALVAAICDTGAQAPLLHLSGTHRRGNIAERLTQAGIKTETAALYDQVLLPLSDRAQALLKGEATVILPLFSPRTAGQFADQAAELRNVRAIAISPAVADTVRHLNLKQLLIAQAPTGDAMRQDIEMLLHAHSLG
jgi:uroporphyrinogen-III synthase